MEIQNQLTIHQVLSLARSTDYRSCVHDEIFSFFNEHFDFAIWKWDDKYSFQKYLNNFYSLQSNIYNGTIYIDNIDKKGKLIESVSWLIETLQNELSSEKNQKIAFELTYIIPKFWAISHEEKIIFSNSSKKLVMKYLSQFESNICLEKSINHKEMVEDFLIENLENKRWKEIEKGQYLFTNINWRKLLSWDFNESCSFIRDPRSLIGEHLSYEILSVINHATKVWDLLYLLAFIPEKYWMSFALQTTNSLAKFFLLFKLINFYKFEIKEEKIQLSNIWQDCPDEWFYIFNKDKCFYPSLQLGFGAFLTNASDEKIRIYIDSLHLNKNEDSIKECLEYFFAHADKNRIQYLCKLAYEKWKDWDFKGSYSFGKSIMDRALVKYFQTMVSKQDRVDFIQNEINQILYFQKKWFNSIVEIDKFFILHLSRMQPVYCAEKLQEDSSLSFEDIQKQHYFPKQLKNDLRWKNWINLDEFKYDE